MNKRAFPSFKSAPLPRKPRECQPPDLVREVAASKRKQDYYYVDASPNFSLFGGNVIEEEPESKNIGRSDFSKLPVVDCLASDVGYRKRLKLCISEDSQSNVFFHPEILTIKSSARVLESEIMDVPSNATGWHDRILNSKVPLDLLRGIAEQFPDDAIINVHYLKESVDQSKECDVKISRLFEYLQLQDFDDFEELLSFAIQCSIPLVHLYGAGFTERFTKYLALVFDFCLDFHTDFPIPVLPEHTPTPKRDEPIRSWIETEKERDQRFFFPKDSSGCLDEPEEDCERSPQVQNYVVESKEEMFIQVAEMLVGVPFKYFSVYFECKTRFWNNRLQMDEPQRWLLSKLCLMCPLSDPNYVTLRKLLMPIFEDELEIRQPVEIAEIKEIMEMMSRSVLTLPRDRNQLYSLAAKNPLDLFIVTHFICYEAQLCSFYRVRRWLFSQWSQIRTSQWLFVGSLFH